MLGSFGPHNLGNLELSVSSFSVVPTNDVNSNRIFLLDAYGLGLYYCSFDATMTNNQLNLQAQGVFDLKQFLTIDNDGFVTD
jgi:hypothetical protein